MSTTPLPHAPNSADDARIDLEAYFARIGYAGSGEPTLETLSALQALHTSAIPFEAIDVLLDRGVDLSPDVVADKLVNRRRGGYCFEQNALFRQVLTSLGFEVQALLARVRWMAREDAPPPPATHMTLSVAVDGVSWLVDVGFGSAVPTCPLDLATQAPQATAHEEFRIVPSGGSRLLQARLEDRWETLYEVLSGPRVAADFEVANWFTSTHPSSHFRHALTVARSTPAGRFALRDARLTLRHPGGAMQRWFLDADGIEEALRSRFSLPVEPEWRPMIERVAARATKTTSRAERQSRGCR